MTRRSQDYQEMFNKPYRKVEDKTTTSDRQLLEFAAIAVGKIPSQYKNSTCYIDGLLDVWKPLEDDGQALSIINILGLSLSHWDSGNNDNSGTVTVGYDLTSPGQDFRDVITKHYKGLADKFSVVRRAIVEKAAQIGKVIPMKNDIMEFLSWAEQDKNATLFHYDGIKKPEPFLNSFEWENIVDEFVDKKEIQ